MALHSAWTVTDPITVGLLEQCLIVDPDDLTSQLILADRLNEIGHPSEARLRAACDLWAAARTLIPEEIGWDKQTPDLQYIDKEQKVFLLGLWTCIVSWYTPTGNNTVLGPAWLVDSKVALMYRWCWWYIMGLLDKKQLNATLSRARAGCVAADNNPRLTGPWLYYYVIWELLNNIWILQQEDDVTTYVDSAGSALSALENILRCQIVDNATIQRDTQYMEIEAYQTAAVGRLNMYAATLWNMIVSHESVKTLL